MAFGMKVELQTTIASILTQFTLEALFLPVSLQAPPLYIITPILQPAITVIIYSIMPVQEVQQGNTILSYSQELPPPLLIITTTFMQVPLWVK